VAVAALRFLLLTGWREGEAVSLKWSEVDFSRGVATLQDTKTGRSARHLGAPALALLADLPRLAGSPCVFPGSKPGTSFTDLGRLWDAVRHAAGLEDVRLHDLRHSFASVAAASGLSLPVIGALLGHRGVATTQRYAHLGDDPRKRAADKVAQRVAAALKAALDARRGPKRDISRSYTAPKSVGADARRNTMWAVA
jgi:integrase